MASDKYSICALAGLTCFVVGAYFQHEVVVRNILHLVQNDPYIYQNRHKLNNLLTLFGCNIDARLKKNISTMDHMRQYIVNPLYALCSYFFIIKNPISSEIASANLIELMKYGFPSIVDIHIHPDYVVSYDSRNCAANWVCEHVTKSSIKNVYVKNDEQSQQLHLNDTYVLTNGSPDVGRVFSCEIWRKMEEYIIELAKKFGSVYVYSGPLYLPMCSDFNDWSLEYKIFGLTPVAIPSHFFKIIIVDSKLTDCTSYMEGYIIPNVHNCGITDTRKFLSDIEDIERYSGLKFVEGLRQCKIFKKKPKDVGKICDDSLYEELTSVHQFY